MKVKMSNTLYSPGLSPMLFLLIIFTASFTAPFLSAQTPATANKQKALSIQEIANRAVPAVVSLRAGGSLDPKSKVPKVKMSGVVLSITNGYGYFVTSDHFAHNKKGVLASYPDWGGFEHRAQMICRDPASRLVLMRVSVDKKSKCKTVRYSDIQTPDIGTPFLLVSFGDKKTKVKWIQGRIGRVISPYKEVGFDDPALAGAEVLRLPGEFYPECTGGPVLDGQARFLGIASFINGHDLNKGLQKAKAGKAPPVQSKTVCFVIPSKLIFAFCLAACDDQLVKFHHFDLTDFKAGLEETENSLDFKSKIDLVKMKGKILQRILALQTKAANIRAKQFDKEFAKMSKRARAIHKKYPQWTPDLVKSICNRQLQNGMNQDMVLEMYGSPKDMLSKNVNEVYLTEWLYHNNGPFGSITKGRSIFFNSKGQVVHWKHMRGNLYRK